MDYYDKNAKQYIEETKNCDMSQLYVFFEKQINGAKSILDIGFGSGRDSVYFKNKGYDVTSIDTCSEFVEYAKNIGLEKAFLMDALEMPFEEEFDAIWASASLLHIKKDKILEAFKKCYNALNNGGVMYSSFKCGKYDGIRDERYYADYTLEEIKPIINEAGFILIDYIITKDVRENNNNNWISIIIKKR